MTTTRSRSPLRDVLYELSMARDVPDADLVDAFVRRYPEHAIELTDFAVELAVDALRRDQTVAAVDAASLSPMVSRAMSKFLNKVHEIQSTGSDAAKEQLIAQTPVENPFAALTREAFRSLAKRLNVNTVFLCKLRDRQIALATMSEGFLSYVAGELRIGVETVTAHFSQQPQITAQPQYFKADQKPQIGPQQSFEEAVRGSGLTEEQQHHLLSL
jgi:hypothetical protein